MAPTMAASELHFLFLCAFCVFLCFSNHSTVVSGHNSVVSFSREELLNIRVLSQDFFTIIHQSEPHRTPDERSRSTLRDTALKASESMLARWQSSAKEDFANHCLQSIWQMSAL
ncbi:hypothetical protein ILYODFUR_012728 [Ilyodon furcidens]|uniref:Uncharacterized protein n=1 Tax=Ilyodon furcidens TaxID=33524 RepID=A0ABV0T059_9TELE